MRRILVWGVFLFVSFISVFSSAQPTLRAMRIATPPVLDGKLDDAVWKAAPAATGFTQSFPQSGQQPSEPTSARVLYDDRVLYVGIECTQKHAKIVQALGRRDRWVESDSVSVSLDSRRDRTTAFELSINAAGVLSDSIRYNDTDSSSDWDEVWEGRAAITASGWSAELAIPLRALRFDKLPVQDWGLQIRRYTSQRQELDEWAFIPRSAAGEVSRYGKLLGLERLRGGSPIQLRPFIVARGQWMDLDRRPPELRFSGTAGLDFKAHLTQNLVLDVTLNPDFGQVEADQVVMNLSSYEIFYPEKRAFFLEGIDTFSTPLGLLYTRRVGRPPAEPVLRQDAPHSERLLEPPGPPTIYGAAKLLGTLGGRLSVGTLSALLGKNQVAIERARVGTFRVVEPYMLQNALRLKLAIGGNAHLGLLATAVNHFEQSGDAPEVPASDGEPARKWCPGGDLVSAATSCFADSFVASIDGRWRSKGGTYLLNAQVVMSAQSGGPPRTLRDGTTLSSGDLGSGGFLQFAKEGGEHFTFDVQAQLVDHKLNFNDLGYMRRQNEFRLAASARYRNMKPWGKVQELSAGVDYVERESLFGLNLERSVQLSSFWLFKNFWVLWSGLHYNGAYFDDREVGDGTALERADLVGGDLYVGSDRRKRFRVGFFTQAQILRNGLNFTVGSEISFRPKPQLDLQLQPQASYTFGEPRYVGPGDAMGELSLGSLRASSVGATLRANYTFTPQLTLQLYAQFLLSARHYDQFWTYTRPLDGSRGVAHLQDLRIADAPGKNPDSSDAALNLSAVLRWEYMPGSVLFLVYSRSQSSGASYAAGDSASIDAAALKKGPGSNALLVKWSYWYG